ncbi:DUF3775 domain-containing protein [Allosphingosinicella flava]|uniref:DUF3775 domain-containing protein n=1 Tax=Allosphingosinicella flava TaxID=2771430 RepID=A0A7T2GKP4_9SPHN|nr:DUF3775 domain-containing protein [Sphingosinicella flava]QPQ55624.1 DUF3775 domain-containing protein [Sphingosinicella flava]
MDLLTPLDSLCRIIIRAREAEAQVPAADPDEDPDNVDDFDDEGGEALSVLEDELNDVEDELRAALDDLADDQLAETLALAWVGRGTYDASEWDEAFAEASENDAESAIDELLDMPLLGSHLEAGLTAFDYSCDGVGQLD